MSKDAWGDTVHGGMRRKKTSGRLETEAPKMGCGQLVEATDSFHLWYWLCRGPIMTKHIKESKFSFLTNIIKGNSRIDTGVL